MIALSCIEFTVEAMISPIDLTAIRPSMMKAKTVNRLGGTAMPYLKCAKVNIAATYGM